MEDVFRLIGNVVIFSKSNCQQVKDSDEVLTLLHRAEVALKVPKRHFSH